MPITLFGTAQAGTSSVTLPASIAAGDIIILWAYRNATTSPSNPTGFTSLEAVSGNSNSARLSYKTAVGTEGSTSVSVTNANVIKVQVYRGAGGVGDSASATNAASTTTGVPALTMTAAGRAWVAAFAGSRQTTSQGTINAMTLRGTSQTGTTSISTGADTNGAVASFSSHTSSAGSSATGAGASVEIIVAPQSKTQPATARISQVYTKTQAAKASIRVNQVYSYGIYVSLPSTAADLTHIYSSSEVADVNADDGTVVDAIISDTKYVIHQFRSLSLSKSSMDVIWKGKVAVATSSRSLKMEVFNFNSSLWEQIAIDTSTAAGGTVTINGTVSTSLTNYYDGSFMNAVRVYQ